MKFSTRLKCLLSGVCIVSSSILLGFSVHAEGSDNGVSITIEDITPEMAANYAVNHAHYLGEDGMSAGIPVKYCNANGEMLGWMVPYVQDGTESGYVLLDFTQEDPVSEFSFDGKDLCGGVMPSFDNPVLVDNDLFSYNVVDEASLPSSVRHIEDGYYVFDDGSDVYHNLYENAPMDGAGSYTTQFLMVANSRPVHMGRDYFIRNYGRYNCGIVAGFQLLKQWDLMCGHTDEEVFRWLWVNSGTMSGDNWDKDYDIIFDEMLAIHGSERVIESFTLNDGTTHKVLYGNMEPDRLRNVLLKWMNDNHVAGNRDVLFDERADTFYDYLESAVSNNYPGYISFHIKCKDSVEIGHAVMFVGCVKYNYSSNPDLASGKLRYAIVSDGYRDDGYKYINYSHTKWTTIGLSIYERPKITCFRRVPVPATHF